MPRKTVSIPGEILKTTVIGGLTFDEVIALASVPLVLVLPSLFIKQIPLMLSLGIIAVGFVGVVIVVFQTPEGQSPLQWFPAYVSRRFNPDKYALKPKDGSQYGNREVNYLDIVRTAELIEEESQSDQVDEQELRDSIHLAEKLEPNDTDSSGIFSSVRGWR